MPWIRTKRGKGSGARLSDGLQKPHRFASDFIAGLTGALVYIPQGIAYSLVAGVAPSFALYTGILAPIVGTLGAGSSFLVIIATNELAIPVGSILAGLGDTRFLFPLTFLVGAFQLVFGFLKFGNLTRFISESVMTGFVTGVALLLVLGQIDELTGYQPSASNVLLRSWELLTHLSQVDLATSLVGVFTIVVIILVQKSRLKSVALIIAMVLASVLAQLLAQPSVKVLGAIAEIPNTLPWPQWPDFSAMPRLIPAALSLAVVGLAVAAGVAQSYPERDGSLPDASRDFIGQGAANALGSFFMTMPAGGSFSRTATSVSAGAQTRWANIFLGLILAVMLLTVGGLTKFFPVSALAGLLIVIGVQALKPERIARVRHTHISERVAMIATCALCLSISLQYAILCGVVLTLLLFLPPRRLRCSIVRPLTCLENLRHDRSGPSDFHC
jgi:SulP family sulfate permease